MAKEKKERKILANGRQFLKKKVDYFKIDECRQELARLTKMNQTASKYFEDVQNRYLELGGNFAK